MNEFTFEAAVRKASPMLISLSSVSGGGKTFSSLSLAAGIAGPDGVVGMIDTENGRGSMYADSPGIIKALPRGFKRTQMDAPFSPERYIQAIESAEKSGVNVLVIDSATHEWEGIGGCCEIAENNKLRGLPNWAKAKMAHKRFMNHCLSSPMTIIFCVRARDKVKIEKAPGKDGKEETLIVPIGIQPVCEKNFIFEQLISLQLDEVTHHAKAIKCPEMLLHLFPGGRLITPDDGRALRQWNSTGISLAPGEQIRKRATAAAEDGMRAYEEFWALLTPKERALLKDSHPSNKAIAKSVDDQRETQERADAEAALAS